MGHRIKHVHFLRTPDDVRAGLTEHRSLAGGSSPR